MTAMTLNDGSMWEPAQEQIEKWRQLYQAVDVQGELNAMVGWLDANPKKRKTSRGINTFINSWLKRAQDKGGQGMAKASPNNAVKTRDMSSLDDLTNNFTGCPSMREYFLGKYGQVFENGQRFTE